MFDDVVAAAVQTFSQPYRSILWISVAASASILAGIGFAVLHLVAALSASWPTWAGAAGSLFVGFGLMFGAAYSMAPISILVAGLFADRLADLAEAELRPLRPGRAAPWGVSLWMGVRFATLAAVLNAIAFCLWLAPGLNAVAFFSLNAYVFGRMGFEMVALRHGPTGRAHELFLRNSGRIFLYGVWISVLLAIPVANLLTPLFSVALMARAYDRLAVSA